MLLLRVESKWTREQFAVSCRGTRTRRHKFVRQTQFRAAFAFYFNSLLNSRQPSAINSVILPPATRHAYCTPRTRLDATRRDAAAQNCSERRNGSRPARPAHAYGARVRKSAARCRVRVRVFVFVFVCARAMTATLSLACGARRTGWRRSAVVGPLVYFVRGGGRQQRAQRAPCDQQLRMH